MKNYMLKFACAIALTIIASICLFPMLAVQARIQIRVDSRNVQTAFEVCTPVWQDGLMFVPLRAVMEAVDFDVVWQPETNTAILTNDDTEIRIAVGSRTMTVNGSTIPLAAPAEIANGRILIPACAVYDAVTMLVWRFGASQ